MAADLMAQIEKALDVLVRASARHRAARDAIAPATAAAERLRWVSSNLPQSTPAEVLHLLADPIGESLRQSIRVLGEHLFATSGDTRGMRAVTERLLVAHPDQTVPVIETLDRAWKGIGTEGSRWAA